MSAPDRRAMVERPGKDFVGAPAMRAVETWRVRESTAPEPVAGRTTWP